jgi:hypothetical protein
MLSNTLRQQLAAEGTPILPAYADEARNLCHVWCEHCERYHHHGLADGHRLAHCNDGRPEPAETPYHRTGYWLEIVGPWTTALWKRREKWSPNNWKKSQFKPIPTRCSVKACQPSVPLGDHLGG